MRAELREDAAKWKGIQSSHASQSRDDGEVNLKPKHQECVILSAAFRITV